MWSHAHRAGAGCSARPRQPLGRRERCVSTRERERERERDTNSHPTSPLDPSHTGRRAVVDGELNDRRVLSGDPGVMRAVLAAAAAPNFMW